MNQIASSHQPGAYRAIADQFRNQRKDRLGQTRIQSADFDALAGAGFLRLSVPVSLGGEWQGLADTGPELAEIIRSVAMGDPSVALVAAMHPAVVAYWHPVDNSPTDNLPIENSPTDQATEVFGDVLDDHWWGTMMSEPGSGGDVAKTKTTAVAEDGRFLLSGEKHFGSGSGQTSFMVTTARANDKVELYVIDMREKDWDGAQGLSLLREWDGHGMTGTQSHAFTLKNCPATLASGGQNFAQAISQTSRISGVLFSAVIVGILDEAFDYALARLQKKQDGMRALERVELVRAQNEHWQAVTLYESVRDGMGTAAGLANARQAKYAIAGHAENALARLSKVVGGNSFGRTSPLGQWAQDVKALGFLRPPWALQNDQLFEALWQD